MKKQFANQPYNMHYPKNAMLIRMKLFKLSR